MNNKAEVFEKPCPLFVPLAEEGWIKHKATYEIAEEYYDSKCFDEFCAEHLSDIDEKSLEENDYSLFQVKDALMFVKRTGTFGGLGSSFYKADNPEFGATFTYYIKKAPKKSLNKTFYVLFIRTQFQACRFRFGLRKTVLPQF